MAVSTALYDRGRELLPILDAITLAAFRDALGVGRRTAQLVLERFDADGLTYGAATSAFCAEAGSARAGS